MMDSVLLTKNIREYLRLTIKGRNAGYALSSSSRVGSIDEK